MLFVLQSMQANRKLGFACIMLKELESEIRTENGLEDLLLGSNLRAEILAV